MFVVQDTATGEYWTSRAGIPYGAEKNAWDRNLQKARTYATAASAESSLTSIVNARHWEQGDYQISHAELRKKRAKARTRYAVLEIEIVLKK